MGILLRVNERRNYSCENQIKLHKSHEQDQMGATAEALATRKKSLIGTNIMQIQKMW